jgi:hypothetical protein
MELFYDRVSMAVNHTVHQKEAKAGCHLKLTYSLANIITMRQQSVVQKMDSKTKKPAELPSWET